MRFRILGPLEVGAIDDETILRRRKPRALLALLLLNANRPVGIDALIDGLWGEDAPPSAHGALQNYISQLRKSLGADVVVTRVPGYAVVVAPDDLDLAVFERLVAEAATADAPTRADLLHEALALWRGAPLPEFADEPFGALEGPRLADLERRVREDLLGTELELGRHAELLPELERRVRETPLDEGLRARLMLALYRTGRQADALASYRDARRILAEELGLEPGEELQRLERAILTHDPALAAPAPAVRAPAAAVAPEVRADRRTVTVLFADVSGSTALGESLDPEALRSLMSSFFAEMRVVVERHGGTVEKFAGDEVMAVFGVPVAHEDDAVRAVRAAQEMLRAVALLDQSLDSHRGIRFRVRIGVNTGEVVAGAASAGGTFVTGAPVSLGKRLQELAEPGTTVIGGATMRLVRDAVAAAPLGEQAVRGTAELVEAFRVVSIDPGAPGVARALDVPIVDRERELAALRTAFESARDGTTCRLVALLGDPGIGKTRLARELVEELEPHARVLVGRCIAYGEGATYLPVVDALRDALDDLEAAVAGEEDGALILESVSSLVHGSEDMPVPAAELAWALRRAFESLARDRPLLVVFDDVHWGEPTFLDLLEYMTAWSQDTPILLLALARPELLEGRTAWAASDAAIETVALRPLGDQETRSLVTRLASTLDEEQLERIIVLAEGLPLFAEQLVAHAEETAGALDLEAVPPTIEALLASRLERLDPDERDVLERAAVIGREFWRGAVAAVTPEEDRAGVGRHLISLVRKAFVQPARSELPREDALRFRHVLVRDVAYGAIPKARRAELHEGAADWLHRRAGESDEVVGYHLEQAYRYRTELGAGDRAARQLGADAGERLGRAGVRALKRSDAPAAISLLTRATALLPSTDTLRLELLLELGVAYHLVGDVERATEVFTSALDDATKARDRNHELRARIELVIIRIATDPEGAGRELLQLAEVAVPVFEALGNHRALGRTWFSTGFVHGAFYCRNATWAESAERALAHYRDAGWSTSSCLHTLAATMFFGPTHVDEAVDRCDELLENEVTDLAGEANVTLWRGASLALRADFDGARAAVAQALRIFGELGQTLVAINSGDYVAGQVETLAGDHEAAEAIYRSGIARLEQHGQAAQLANRAAELADTLVALGRDDEAAEWIETARTNSASDDISAQFTWRSVAAKLAARSGDFEGANELAARALELVDETDALNQRAAVRLDYAGVLLAGARHDEARMRALEAETIFGEKGNLVGIARARSMLDRTAGA